MKRILFAVLVAVAVAGCFRNVPIRNVEDVPIVRYDGEELTLDQVERAIAVAGGELGWVMQPVKPGHLVGVLDLRKHQAVVDIFYDPESFSIHYKDSTNLLFDPSGTIHRNYNNWIANLERNINAEIQRLR